MLGDVDEAAAADELAVELADVDVAVAIDLRRAQERMVDAAAAVPVELHLRLDERLGVQRHAEIPAAGGDAADRTCFGGQRHHRRDAFLGCHRRHAGRHADAEVDDIARVQLHRRAPRDDQPLIERHRRGVVEARAVAAGEAGVELRAGRLPMVLRLRDHEIVDQHARHAHRLGMHGAGPGDVFDLGDDDAAAVARGLGQRQAFQQRAFVLDHEVAVLVRRRAADDRHVDLEGRVEHPLLALERHHLDDVLGGLPVQLAALQTRIDEGAETGLGQQTRTMRRDVAPELRDHALRQAIALAVGVGDHLGQRRGEAGVAADPAREHPAMREMPGAAVLPVADAGGMNQRQPGRMARAEKPLFYRDGKFLGPPGERDRAGADDGAVLDHARRITCRDQL